MPESRLQPDCLERASPALRPTLQISQATWSDLSMHAGKDAEVVGTQDPQSNAHALPAPPRT